MSGIKTEYPTENWTRLPNWIADNLPKIHECELKILIWMVRQNLGWKEKRNERFSISYLKKHTGLSKPTILKYLKTLIKKNFILQHSAGNNNRSAEYSVAWESCLAVNVIDQGVQPRLPRAVNHVDLSKETNLKKQVSKETEQIPETGFALSSEEIKRNHKELMDLCSDSHLDIYGHRPKLNGISGKAMQRMLKEHDGEEIREQILRAKEIVQRHRRENSRSDYWRCFTIVPEQISKRWNEIKTNYGSAKVNEENKTEQMEKYVREHKTSDWVESELASTDVASGN